MTDFQSKHLYLPHGFMVMKIFVYDGSFKGFLVACYQALPCEDEVRFRKTDILQGSLFDQVHFVEQNEFHLRTITFRLKALLGPAGFRFLWKAYLSELPSIEECIFGAIRYAIQMEGNVLDDLRKPEIYLLHQAVRLVNLEVQRVERSLTFRRREEYNLAIVDPKLNVLPLVAGDLSNRHTRRQRLIYDRKRGYGMYCNPGPDYMRTVRGEEIGEIRPSEQFRERKCG